MRCPRVSVADLLQAIAILALDLAAVDLVRRGTSRDFWDAKLLFAVLPMINALVFGLMLLGRELTVRGEGTPFLVGFQAAGWPAVAAALIAMLGFENQTSLYVRRAEASLSAFWHEFIEWTGEFTVTYWGGIKFGFDVFALVAPQLLLCLLGGWAAGRLGVSVVQNAAPMGRPRAIPARRAKAALVVAAVLLGAGVWGAKIRGRWLIYRGWADSAAQYEPVARRYYEQALEEIRSLEQNQDETERRRTDRAARRKSLVKEAELWRSEIERSVVRRKIYEPAARRPWLPIPPNPPLNALELEKPR